MTKFVNVFILAFVCKLCLAQNLDDFDNEGKTQLMNVSQAGNLGEIEKLIEQGAAINLQNTNGSSALSLAIVFEQFKAAKVLLENGANPNLHNASRGENVIFVAARSNDLRFVRLLSGKGANMNAIDGYGDTALNIALRIGIYDQAVNLLKHGVDPTVRNKEGINAIDILQSMEWSKYSENLKQQKEICKLVKAFLDSNRSSLESDLEPCVGNKRTQPQVVLIMSITGAGLEPCILAQKAQSNGWAFLYP